MKCPFKKVTIKSSIPLCTGTYMYEDGFGDCDLEECAVYDHGCKICWSSPDILDQSGELIGSKLQSTLQSTITSNEFSMVSEDFYNKLP